MASSLLQVTVYNTNVNWVQDNFILKNLKWSCFKEINFKLYLKLKFLTLLNNLISYKFN